MVILIAKIIVIIYTVELALAMICSTKYITSIQNSKQSAGLKKELLGATTKMVLFKVLVAGHIRMVLVHIIANIIASLNSGTGSMAVKMCTLLYDIGMQIQEYYISHDTVYLNRACEGLALAEYGICKLKESRSGKLFIFLYSFDKQHTLYCESLGIPCQL